MVQHILDMLQGENMDIIIVGAGKFGRELTEHLAKENHNITVIDAKASVVEEVVNQFDVIGICGNGASSEILEQANPKTIELLIATAANDETNILCCLVAKQLGIKQTIARIRNPEYIKQIQAMNESLGISMSLNPDIDTAREIARILRFPSAIKVETFANGKVDLVEIKVEKNSPLCNAKLNSLREKHQVRILVCAVKRNNEVVIPNGDFVLKEGDFVYITADNADITKAFRKLNILKNKSKSVLIVGGGKTAYQLATQLIQDGVSVKIFEKDYSVCEQLSEKLPHTLIINGDATNQKLLLAEGIENVDAVVTLTGIDETNIIISSYAKNLGVEKVITKVNNTNYDSILSNIGLDSVVSPKEIFSSHIIRYVRGIENTRGSIFKTLYRLVGNRVEALELSVSRETKYTSIPLKNLKIKDNYLLAAIIRANRVIIPSGKDTLEPLDSVIIITTNTFVKDLSDIME